MKFRLIALAASLGWLLYGCAEWQGKEFSYAPNSVDGSQSDAAWATLDSNRDGVLSLDEITAQRAVGLLRDFPNADSNRDGRISRDEWNSWWPRMTRTRPSPAMARLNGPGRVADAHDRAATEPMRSEEGAN